jgi:hypothetical protein
MSKNSGPSAPDYTGVANQQAAQNQQNTTAQTWANRPNQTSPFGSSTWGTTTVKDPTTGQDVTQWTQNTTLDPKLQGALNSQMDLTKGRSDLAGGMLGNVQNSLGQPMDYSGFTQMSQGPQAYNFGGGGPIQSSLDYSGAQNVGNAADTRAKAEQNAYASQTSRLDPRFDAQQRSMETDLANRGISRDSEAYTRAMDDFNRNKNDAYQQAQMGAITAGGTEAQRDYGMDLGLRQQQVNEAGTQGQFANTAQQQQYAQGMQGNSQNFNQQLQASNYQNQLRQQQIAEAMQQRGQGLNEMNALLQGQQVQTPQFGSFGQAAQAQTPDLLGAASSQYGAAQGQQSSKNAMFGDVLGGLGQLAGSYFGFSDRRVKTEFRRIGRHPKGFGIYRYRYIGERGTRVGVIAQEVRRRMPEAVRENSGVLMVDYARVGALM